MRRLQLLIAMLAVAGCFPAMAAAPQSALPAPAASTPVGPRPAVASPPATTPASVKTPDGKTLDRVELDQTTITGNRELPNVMVIVPWKESSPGMVDPSAASLLEDALEPLDREEFRRELQYRRVLGKAPQASARGQSATGSQTRGDTAASTPRQQD